MDPRIRVALVAYRILDKLHRSGRLKGDLRALRAKLMELQWVNDLEYLKEESKKLGELVKDLKYSDRDEKVARWCIDVLKKLPEKFERGEGDSILLGLDCGVGEVLSVHELDEKLKVCRISSKLGDFTVVTNIKEVKKGDRLPFVVLPPRKFGEVWSEAMFVWGPVKDLKEVDWKKVEGEVSAIIEGY